LPNRQCPPGHRLRNQPAMFLKLRQISSQPPAAQSETARCQLARSGDGGTGFSRVSSAAIRFTAVGGIVVVTQQVDARDNRTHVLNG
jgi:hypothetical protein